MGTFLIHYDYRLVVYNFHSVRYNICLLWEPVEINLFHCGNVLWDYSCQRKNADVREGDGYWGKCGQWIEGSFE